MRFAWSVHTEECGVGPEWTASEYRYSVTMTAMDLVLHLREQVRAFRPSRRRRQITVLPVGRERRPARAGRPLACKRVYLLGLEVTSTTRLSSDLRLLKPQHTSSALALAVAVSRNERSRICPQ